jgi:hypothetical protein
MSPAIKIAAIGLAIEIAAIGPAIKIAATQTKSACAD